MLFANNQRSRRASRCLTVNSAMKYIDEKTTKFHSKLRIPIHGNSILPKGGLKNLKRKQKKNVFYSLILSLLTILLAFYENERCYSLNSEVTIEINILRFIIMIFVFVHIALIYRYHKRKLQIKILYREISLNTSLYQEPSLRKYFILDLFLSVIFAPPFASVTITFAQISKTTTMNISDILFIFALCRIVHLANYVFENSIHNSDKAKFHSDLQFIKNPYKFSIKAMITEKPITYLVIIFGICTIMYGVLIRIYERHMADTRFAYVWNGIWLISVTQSSIGYGDIVAESHLGRVLCIIASFFGTFMYSYVVMYVKNIFLIKGPEIALFNGVYNRCELVKVLKIHAVKFIQAWWRLKLARKQKKFSFQKIMLRHFYLKRFQYHKNVSKGEKNVSFEEQIDLTIEASDKMFRSIFTDFRTLKETKFRLGKYKHSIVWNHEKLNILKKEAEKYSDNYEDNYKMRLGSELSSRANLKSQGDRAYQNLFKTRISPPSVKIEDI